MATLTQRKVIENFTLGINKRKVFLMYSDFLKDLSEVHNSKTEWFVHNMYKTVIITMDGDKSRIGIHCNCFVYNNYKHSMVKY